MKNVLFFFCLLNGSLVHSQNIGIGTTAPTAPLHIKNTNPELLKLESNIPYISFYSGSIYKGYLWHTGGSMQLGSAVSEPVVINANYNSFPAYFTPNGRLGLGISNPSERLDVNGNINLAGLIKINGNSGTAGQVLTSNGTSNPSWTSAPLSNNIKFGIEFVNGPGIPDDDETITATKYNLSPADVVISTSSIILNHSGLYHFDIGVSAQVTYLSAPTSYPQFSLALFNGFLIPIGLIFPGNMSATNAANTNWIGGDKVSIEVFISAPAEIKLHHGLNSVGSFTRSVRGYMLGHLISD
jgi:hypothetical protein